MYSRNIFPKYGSGGLPIPENYSGNAIRRPPVSGGAANGTDRAVSGIPYAPPRVHTSPQRPVGLRAAVEDSGFAAVKDTVNDAVLDGFAETVTDVGAVMSEQPTGCAEHEGAERGEHRGGHESHDDGEGCRGGEVARPPAVHPREGGESPAPRGDSGLGAMLSRLLPPKMGGGALAQVGLEEALLMGLFLILSQSEAEDDTLLLLALLFLYR